MPASPPVVDPVDTPSPAGGRRRRAGRRRLHVADLLVTGVVVVLVAGFVGARRIGIAPRQPVPNFPPPTTPAPLVAVALPSPDEAAALGVPVPTPAPTSTAVPAPPRRDDRDPIEDAVAAAAPPPASPIEQPFAVRDPDPRRPVGVLVVGDNLAAGLGGALARNGAVDGGITARTRAVAASGLARPDLYDWTDRIGSVVEPQDELVVLFLGLNDAQPLSLSVAPTGPVGSPDWVHGYRARLGAVIDGAGPRPVVVVGLPAVENTGRDRELETVRAAVFAEAAAHANVRYVDLNAAVSDGGRFVRYLDGGDGTEISARSNDGEQFTDAGFDLVAAIVRAAVWPSAAAG